MFGNNITESSITHSIERTIKSSEYYVKLELKKL